MDESLARQYELESENAGLKEQLTKLRRDVETKVHPTARQIILGREDPAEHSTPSSGKCACAGYMRGIHMTHDISELQCSTKARREG